MDGRKPCAAVDTGRWGMARIPGGLCVPIGRPCGAVLRLGALRAHGGGCLFLPKGANLVGPVTVAVLGYLLPYAACGCLQARWAALSKLDRSLRLAPVVRPLFLSVLPSSSNVAFGDLNKFIAVFVRYIRILRDHGSPFAAQVPGHHMDMQPTVANH